MAKGSGRSVDEASRVASILRIQVLMRREVIAIIVEWRLSVFMTCLCIRMSRVGFWVWVCETRLSRFASVRDSIAILSCYLWIITRLFVCSDGYLLLVSTLSRNMPSQQTGSRSSQRYLHLLHEATCLSGNGKVLGWLGLSAHIDRNVLHWGIG